MTNVKGIAQTIKETTGLMLLEYAAKLIVQRSSNEKTSTFEVKPGQGGSFCEKFKSEEEMDEYLRMVMSS